jgi:predicted DNA-binding protein (UPF0251 family)
MKPRGRPKKQRIIKCDPRVNQFSPRGKPGRPDEIEISLDEFEAIRLTDYDGLSQQESAQSMRISQQTFSRILRKARRKAADGLVNGKTIRIQQSTGQPQAAKKDSKNSGKDPQTSQYFKSLNSLSRYPGS